MKFASAIPLLLLASSAMAWSQSPIADEHPLPDIPTLMHEVEDHQRDSEAIQKDYLYHQLSVAHENDGKGALKKSEIREYDVFWLNGVEVRKMTKKDGKDLTEDEKKKENERLDKEVEKAKERKSKAGEKGQETDSHGHEEITVSRFLLLGRFTNPRRVQIDGRDTIAVDYTGDPKAKTQNRAEDVIRNLSGTIWVDESDRSIARLEGHFVNSYKIGGGLVMNIKKDTSFSMQQRKINGEVWLPSRIEGQGAARVLLFVNFNGSVLVINSDYRKFKATSTILPGVATLDESSPDNSAVPPPVPQ
jgi:hypothetical protein